MSRPKPLSQSVCYVTSRPRLTTAYFCNYSSVSYATLLSIQQHGLIINKTKCVECLFYFKSTSSQLPFSFINGEALSREQTAKYLGVHFTSNMTWSTHIDTVFTKCLNLPFFIQRLSKLNVYKSLLWRLFSTCAIPLVLY